MSEKPTYEELVGKIKELEQESAKRKQMEKALQESEAHYRQIFSIAPAGIYEVDFRTGKFTDVNEAVCEYLGHTRDKLLSMSATDMLTKDSQKRFLSRIVKALNGEDISGSIDYEIIKKDGSTGWLRINNRYIYDGENIIGSTVVAHDISERKRAEEELKKSEQKFRALVNAAPYGIQLTDKKGKILYSNPAHHAIQGYADGKLIGKYIWDFIKDEEKKIRTKKYYADLTENVLSPVVYFNKNQTKDGRLIDVQINWDYIRNTSGGVEGIISIVRDITEKKQLEDALRESNEHLKSLMDSATGFVVYRMVRDDNAPPYNLKMASVSPSVEEVLGYKPEDFEVSSYYDHLHPDDVEGAMKAHKVAFETGKYEKTARVYKPTTGDYVWIHAISIAVKDKNGEISHTNGIFIDVTEKYKAYQKLKDSEQELESKTKNLIEMNAALNALIKNMEVKESDFQEQVTANIQHLVLPYLHKFKDNTANSTRKSLVDIVELNLNKITANFTRQLSSSLYSLTSTEIKVADLVRLGKPTKEIATTLNISYKTVESHRERIRKKLGISNQKINLRSHLLSIK